MVTDIYWTTKCHSNFLHVFLFKRSIVSSKVLMLVSLFCVSSETHNLQPSFCMFCKESLGKINFRAFPKLVGPQILSLESVDYSGTSEHYWVVRKKLGGAIFHCMQLGLVMSMQFIWWLKWRAMWITFLIAMI